MKHRLVLFLLLCAAYSLSAQMITTVVGNGTMGFSGDGGPAINAEIKNPQCVAFDHKGNMYIADYGNYRIRKVDTYGIITTLAGGGSDIYLNGGPATQTGLDEPIGIAVDQYGNIYIVNIWNSLIKKVDSLGIITTFAGGGGNRGDGEPATAAELEQPYAVAVDTHGNVYIGESGTSKIRKVNSEGIISTIAGVGVECSCCNGIAATAACLYEPTGIAIDSIGNVYISDDGNDQIKKIDTSGLITFIAGTGVHGYNGDGGAATLAELGSIGGIQIDGDNNIFVADVSNERIRKIDKNGIITTVAGTGFMGYNGDHIPATDADLNIPNGVALMNNFDLYISDSYNARIRMIRSTLSANNIPVITERIDIFPNPSPGDFYLNIHSVINEEAQISIRNLLGNTLLNTTISTNIDSHLTLDVPDGIYLISARTRRNYWSRELRVGR